MTEANEQAYNQGNRAAYVDMLRLCLKMLGYDDPESQHAAWILEREATIAQLRDVCGSYGDNDWPDDLSLADVVEKHLARHLPQGDNGKRYMLFTGNKPPQTGWYSSPGEFDSVDEAKQFLSTLSERDWWQIVDTYIGRVIEEEYTA